MVKQLNRFGQTSDAGGYEFAYPRLYAGVYTMPFIAHSMIVRTPDLLPTVAFSLGGIIRFTMGRTDGKTPNYSILYNPPCTMDAGNLLSLGVVNGKVINDAEGFDFVKVEFAAMVDEIDEEACVSFDELPHDYNSIKNPYMNGFECMVSDTLYCWR